MKKNFTSCIRHQGSEQDEAKAEKYRQHFYDKFSNASWKRFGVFFTFQRATSMMMWIRGKAATSELSLNLVPYLNMPAPRSHHLLIITDCYN